MSSAAIIETARARKVNETAQYFAILILAPVLLLACWIGFKLGFENRFSGRNAAGYSGLVAGPKPSLLFIGSSHTRQSYDAEAIEADTGKSAFVLSYSALDLNSMDVLLRELLPDPSHRPAVLVLEAYSAKLGRYPEIGDPRLFFDAPPGLKLKILENYLHYHPGFSSWLDVFDLVVNRGTDQIVTYPLNSRVLAGMSYKGSYRGHTIQGLTLAEFHSLQADIPPGTPDPYQLAAFRDIVSLTRQYGVKLVLAESPMPQPISSRPEIQSLKAAFREQAGKFNLPYLDGDAIFPIDEPMLFADESHVSTAGRALYTARMVSYFAPVFGVSQQLASHRPFAETRPQDSLHQGTGVSLYRH
jgi:hypothetical protein